MYRCTARHGLGLSFEPSETGTYEAVVFVDTSRPISYSLSLEPGFGRLIAEKGPVPLGEPVNGEIAFSEGRDLYTFEGAFLRTVSRLLDESDDVSALRSRIVDALRRQGFHDAR